MKQRGGSRVPKLVTWHLSNDKWSLARISRVHDPFVTLAGHSIASGTWAGAASTESVTLLYWGVSLDIRWARLAVDIAGQPSDWILVFPSRV